MQRGVSDDLESIIERALEQGRSALLETEGLEIARALGIDIPDYVLFYGSDDARERPDFLALAGDRVVVKAVSPTIRHKTEVGAVRVVPNGAAAVIEAIREMEHRFAGGDVVCFMVSRYVDHEAGPGGELLVGMRRTEDFGPVVTVAPGGVYTEFLASHMRPGDGAAIFSPLLADRRTIRATLEAKPVTRLVTEGFRGRRAGLPAERLVRLVEALLRLAHRADAIGLREFEINPLALTEEGPVALDALASLGTGPPRPPERPRAKLGRLLRPRSAALIGVSRRRNPGRIILENMLREGFPRERIFIVKPECERIEGCRCYPSVDALPERVDLFILAVDAAQVPPTLRSIVEGRRAESLIVIPGGLGERAGSEALMRGMEEALRSARESAWRGPVINGGNCLGVRSRPGRYDTLFIPEHKLPRPRSDGSHLAVISQSGAFAVSKLSKLEGLDPRYLVSLGNQFDLTVGDYLSYLAGDPELDVFACYVEGFRPLDGARWLEAADELRRQGKTVILYRAGRTEAGARASASHTASIAGDYGVTRELALAGGVVLAGTIEEFEDLVRTFCALREKRVGGWRLGALSNAGFECVALADARGRFELPRFGAATEQGLRRLLERCRLEEIVGVRNPFDATPIMGDEAFAEAARLVLQDGAVDVGVVGCVPLTGALQTLPAGPGHAEDLRSPESIASRLAELRASCEKPFLAVVDAGPLYDPLVRALWSRGVPTFRSADRALRLLEAFCRRRLDRRRSG